MHTAKLHLALLTRVAGRLSLVQELAKADTFEEARTTCPGGPRLSNDNPFLRPNMGVRAHYESRMLDQPKQERRRENRFELSNQCRLPGLELRRAQLLNILHACLTKSSFTRGS
jgi:hypothetical protein